MSQVENGKTRPVTILLAEDDLGHAKLIEKNLKRANLTNNIVTVHNGREAVDFLSCAGRFEGRQRPDHLLVLLDLNMPVMDGYQVLEHMKTREDMRRIPVVMLTTTDSPQEINRCYELGCNVYVTKPVDYESFCAAVRQIGLFLSVVTVPDRA